MQSVDLVKKGQYIVVFVKNNGIDISFDAYAMQDGKLGDKIKVQKKDLTRLSVEVIGMKKAQIR